MRPYHRQKNELVKLIICASWFLIALFILSICSCDGESTARSSPLSDRVSLRALTPVPLPTAHAPGFKVSCALHSSVTLWNGIKRTENQKHGHYVHLVNLLLVVEVLSIANVGGADL